MQEKYKPTGTLTISPAKRRKILKVVARLPPSGLGSAALPVALPVALAGRWAVGGGLWERGMVSVRQSVRPSVRREVEAQSEPPAPDLAPAATAETAATAATAEPSPAQEPPLASGRPRCRGTGPVRMRARPRQPAPAQRPARGGAGRRGARSARDPRRTLTGPPPDRAHTQGVVTKGRGWPRHCALLRSHAQQRGGCSEPGGSGPVLGVEKAGRVEPGKIRGGPVQVLMGSWAGRRASFHFPGSSRDAERVPRHLSPRAQGFGGNGAQGWGKEQRDPQASVPGAGHGRS